jgi:NADH:ubiquinone oxidoreductase subunit C
MSEFFENIVSYFFVLCSNKVKNISVKNLNVELEVDKKNLISLIAILKYHSALNFDVLTDISSIDKFGKKYRFVIFYNFFSLLNNLRIFVVCQTKEGSPINSLVDLFCSSS